MERRSETLLSEQAQLRLQRDLPILLGVVRWRRRRRTLGRAAFAGALFVAAWLGWPRPAETTSPAVPPRWTTFGDDPSVLARCVVPTRVDAAWFVDDGELQALLSAEGLPDGMVRTPGRVQVAVAAIEPWAQP